MGGGCQSASRTGERRSTNRNSGHVQFSEPNHKWESCWHLVKCLDRVCMKWVKTSKATSMPQIWVADLPYITFSELLVVVWVSLWPSAPLCLRSAWSLPWEGYGSRAFSFPAYPSQSCEYWHPTVQARPQLPNLSAMPGAFRAVEPVLDGSAFWEPRDHLKAKKTNTQVKSCSLYTGKLWRWKRGSPIGRHLGRIGCVEGGYLINIGEISLTRLIHISFCLHTLVVRHAPL